MALPSVRKITTFQDYIGTLGISHRQFLGALATVSFIDSSFFHHSP